MNKLETRVELFFDAAHSPSISRILRERILHALAEKIDPEGVVRIVVQDSRSQWQNKQIAIERLTILLRSAISVRKKRVSTKPTKTSKENRLHLKKARSETKRQRKVVLE